MILSLLIQGFKSLVESRRIKTLLELPLVVGGCTLKIMNKDTQIIHHLWWLRKFLNAHFGRKSYKTMHRKELDTDTMKEIDALVAHIKLNY